MRCGLLMVLAMLAALVVSGNAPVRAQEERKEHAASEAHSGGKEHGDKEHPAEKSVAEKIFAPALDLTVWTIVVFLILLFILTKYAWAPMLKGLEAREHSIHQAVEEAHKAREETARLRDEVLRERAKAEEESRATIEAARRDAQKQADELRAKAVAEIHAERDRLRRDLELARDAALQDLWAQTAQLATLVSSRAIGRELSPEDHRKLTDEAIADLRRAGAERQKEVAGV
jgi:F-type H+-transporting ATPase subunit b